MGPLDRLLGRAGTEVEVARLLRGGLFDAEWFEAQTGKTYPNARAAAREYLTAGRRAGYSPHPLFEPDYADRGGEDEALRHYLETEASWTTSPHPLFDLKAAAAQLGEPEAAPAESLWARWARDAAAETVVPTSTSLGPLTWGELRPVLLEVAAQWRRARAEVTPSLWRTAAAAPRVAGRTSIVVPVARDRAGMTRQLRWLERAPADADWELVLAGVRSRAHWAFLRATERDPRLVLVPRSAKRAAVLNAAVLACSGDVVVLVHRDTVPDAAMVAALRAALADPTAAVVQPLNVHADSTIYSAGAWFPEHGTAARLLEGHPVEDAERLGDATLPGIFSTVVACRAATFVRLHGLDASYDELVTGTEFSLRAAAEGLGESRLIAGARVPVGSIHGQVPTPEASRDSLDLLHRHRPQPPAGSAAVLAEAGFRAVRGTSRLARLTPPDLAADRPRLRWAIDIAAPVGPRGNTWGDRHFARALAAALRRLGQDVTIDHREARGRASRALDDVVVVLRGRNRVEPVPGPVHLLWVISHPEDVTADEAAGYDAVFAASFRWAAQRTAEWGREVAPLLQCTDPSVFNPGRSMPDSGPAVLFVGNSRGIARPVVTQAIAAGAPVQVYGDGWDGLIPAGHVTATVAVNREVAALYASAGVVLNDHWEDMRREGFLSNRLFDAVACAARVVSDPVSGLREVFGDTVQVFESRDDLARLLTPPYEAFPSRADREREAGRIAAEHSFDARAAALLDAAVERLRQRTGAG